MSPAPKALQKYREKRDFARTPEPSGDRGPDTGSKASRFVIQRHRARRLHYDFRLEIDGVLVSWAVPKGVTRDPNSRHLAVHVEDHPLDYIDFEGIIPEGEYGGGDVIVWDRGTWQPHGTDDPRAAIEAGELHADLFGEKVAGRVVLIRTRRDRGKDNWLVLHKNDEQAVPGWDPEQYPRSVLSGRTNDEVAAAPARKWTRAGEVALGPARHPAPTPEELAELDALQRKGLWRFQGRELALTNLDKVLFPGRGGPPVTKRELIRHYSVMAPVLLPYLVDRPLNLHRFPDGVERKGFWQKEAPAYAPEWIRRWHNDEADTSESQCYLVAEEPATLAWLANHGAVELHAWTSRGPSFDETRAWTEQLSRAIGATVPDLVSWSWEKRDRAGLARLDYTQNAINKTLVAPYCVRPAAGAPVSVPIAWDELDDPDFAADRWTVRTIGARLADRGDPMAPILTDEQLLPVLT